MFGAVYKIIRLPVLPETLLLSDCKSEVTQISTVPLKLEDIGLHLMLVYAHC